MNKLGLLVITMLATGVTLASTLPAHAQEPYNDHAPDYAQGYGGYGNGRAPDFNGSYNPSGRPVQPLPLPGGPVPGCPATYPGGYDTTSGYSNSSDGYGTSNTYTHP